MNKNNNNNWEIDKQSVSKTIEYFHDFKASADASFTNYLKHFAPVFSKVVTNYLIQARNWSNDSSSANVDKYLFEPLLNYTNNSGKLHRPLTCLAAYMCSGGKAQDIVKAFAVASSIEHFQSAALIHDDIADNATLRRGKPCLHNTQGLGLAINDGDFGLAMTTGIIIRDYFERTPDNFGSKTMSQDQLTQILQEINLMEYMTIQGQATDLGWSKDECWDVTIDDYIEMATNKTAFYSVAVPCVLGAICADADREAIKSFRRFGLKCGLAFQIKDDLMNLVEEQDSKSLKNSLNDITEGKRTLIVCHALSNLQGNEKTELINILNSGTTNSIKLAKAVMLMDKAGSLNYAQDFANKLSQEAKEILQENFADSQWKNILIDMATWAISREN